MKSRRHRAALPFALLATLMPLLAVAADDTLQVFVTGDSTACDYGPERYPRTGWGQVLARYVDASIEVRNRAQNGRSSKSYVEQGWLERLAPELKPGDLLLIQFGHNDEKREDPARYTDPGREFPETLQRYLELARHAGARPVLVTPVARHKFAHGEPVDTHGPYAEAVRDLARREGVPLIDLSRSSMDWLRAAGEEASRADYLYDPERGLADDTHFHERGAVMIACFVAAGLVDLGLVPRARLVRDTDCGAHADAREALARQRHPSQVAAESGLGHDEPGPHGGNGVTTAFPFFADAPELGFVLRKRVLHPGASIGLHQHDHDEIYYVAAGQGIYNLDGKLFSVGAGQALLTRAGSTHSLRQVGGDDLVILVAYPNATGDDSGLAR
jgi:lysophospholipase L1-like esterase/mannose-6-phosphate isomerase-like protein (cupin superfamily)